LGLAICSLLIDSLISLARSTRLSVANSPAQPIIHPRPELMSRLLKLHKVVGQLVHETPDILQVPEVLRALENELVHVMVRCLAEGAGVETTLGDRRHGAVVARFEEFLEAHPDRPLYLTEICAAIGVAERTLRKACEEHVGMGPIRFLTLRRMPVQTIVCRARQAAKVREA
jgi:hypothetical protein